MFSISFVSADFSLTEFIAIAFACYSSWLWSVVTVFYVWCSIVCLPELSACCPSHLHTNLIISLSKLSACCPSHLNTNLITSSIFSSKHLFELKFRVYRNHLNLTVDFVKRPVWWDTGLAVINGGAINKDVTYELCIWFQSSYLSLTFMTNITYIRSYNNWSRNLKQVWTWRGMLTLKSNQRSFFRASLLYMILVCRF